MTASQETATPPAPTPTPTPASAGASPAGGALAGLRARVAPQHLALVAVLGLSAVLNINALSKNGYANIFYSAGISSMLHSLHNFVFVSFDPGGLVTVDKPPLGLWVQAASAKLFGFSPLSLLLPEAIAGVLAVAVLYQVMVRRFGRNAALAGALALAVCPSFVAVSRDNGVDPVLILLMVLACGAGLAASETGRWRTLLWCAVLVGLAFNTKTLAAYLVVPGIAVAYLVCAPGSIGRRAGQLLVAGLLMLAVSFSWIAFVDLTPASQRPYVGSSTNNSELEVTFDYNGFGRVEGQVGGPGRVPVGAGALARAQSQARRGAGAAQKAAAKLPPPVVNNGREKNPIPFGGSPGPLRLFGVGLGDQGAWILPFALFGLLAVALVMLADRARRLVTSRSPAPGAPGGSRRRDPRLAATLVLGGWFVVEAVVLSLSKGIVHPYYVSALAPGAAAMAGAGAVAFVELTRGRRVDWRIVLAPCATVATVAAQLVLLQREHYMHRFVPLLLVGATAGIIVLLVARRFAGPAMALTFCLLLVAPTAYAATTWLAPVQGTFPAAGPTQAIGAGGVGLAPPRLDAYRGLIHYVNTHGPGSRWRVLTDAATTAAPFILLGLDAGALAGYSGTDPALDGPGLARLVKGGQARYVLLGGEFDTRGGNRATSAVLRACRQLPDSVWQGTVPSSFGLVLFDCAGRERELSA
jgi:4-amino-4-deoxy-L-arabinose transferase-like glycosyltransferase